MRSSKARKLYECRRGVSRNYRLQPVSHLEAAAGSGDVFRFPLHHAGKGADDGRHPVPPSRWTGVSHSKVANVAGICYSGNLRRTGRFG